MSHTYLLRLTCVVSCHMLQVAYRLACALSQGIVPPDLLTPALLKLLRSAPRMGTIVVLERWVLREQQLSGDIAQQLQHELEGLSSAALEKGLGSSMALDLPEHAVRVNRILLTPSR